MFKDRREAGRRLAEAIARLSLRNPILLGIPRGGVVVAAEAARALGADLDVVLARKLRHPAQPELAIGAIGEDAHVVLNAEAAAGVSSDELELEKSIRLAEIAKRRDRYRSFRPAADLAGRDVVLVDDGVATGSTMEAAIHLVSARSPARVVVALPVAPPSVARRFAAIADDLICLETPARFFAVGQFYEQFDQVSDEEVILCLQGRAEVDRS